MSDDTTTATMDETDGRPRSRRAVLGTVAATGALATVPAVGFAQDDEDDGEDDAAEGEDGTAEGVGDLETVAEFDPPALPENIAIDSEGTVYLSMGPTGEIRAVDPEGEESSVATLETGEEGLLLGITVMDGDLYAANAAGESESHGVWRVDTAGEDEPERIAALPPEETMPNGIIPDPYGSDALLVSDHLGGAIWRVTTDGEAESWVDHELLEPDMEADSPVGADGLAVHPEAGIYTDNLNRGSVIHVPVEDGAAGEPNEIVQDERLVGADGMTFDEEGALYVAVNAADEIVRVTPDRELETVVAGDGLDFPADIHFGTTAETETVLYIANFAFGTFLADESAAEPSLARIDVGVSGYFPDRADDGDETAAEDDTAPDDSDETAAEDDAAPDDGDETAAEE